MSQNVEDTEPQQEDAPLAKVIDLITLDPEQTEVDLNHGRIGKIENFEPLVNLERWVLLVFSNVNHKLFASFFVMSGYTYGGIL